MLNHFPALQILRWGLTLQGVTLVVLLLLTSLQPPLWMFATSMIVAIGSLGVISSNIQSCYMDYFKQNSGTAAALFGATQFTIAGVVSGISTLLPESLFYIVLVQALCSVIYLRVIWRKQNIDK
ncbi:hypothetical protein [Aliiglaciecola lipolytica]|uniref:hypothetical protein n=1 Tax=Aliiglaciecola lipolytica TaxID=477689 RepID=UPI001C09513A|nr:hypothetical protein [Aliiglaciecola lipolytica]MBU2878955.1 hypothetical protein [Aliiglaciecola lipolytica]